MSEDAEADQPATPDHPDPADGPAAGTDPGEPAAPSQPGTDDPTSSAEPDAPPTDRPDAPAEAAGAPPTDGPGEPDPEAGEPASPLDASDSAAATEPDASSEADDPAAATEPGGSAAGREPDEAEPEVPAEPNSADEPSGPDRPAAAGAGTAADGDEADEPAAAERDPAADEAAEAGDQAEAAGAPPTDGPSQPEPEAGEPASPLDASHSAAATEPDESADDAAEQAEAGDQAGTAGAVEPAGTADQAEAAGGRARRSLTVRWLLPLVLAATTLASAVGALTLDADEAASAIGDRGAATTPLLSARRAPEVLAEPVAARRLQADLRAWLAQSPPDTCLVVDDAGQHVFEHNPTTPLAGASTQKLLTSTALLLALGADARLETTAVAAGEPSRGVIDGHLYVVGGGDALLATRSWRDHFRRQPRTIDDVEQLAQAIVDAGVTRITGSVIGDASRYESQTYHPAWPRRFFDDREVGPIGGLMVNDGFASFPSAATPGAPTLPSRDVGADAANILTLALRVRGVEVVGPPRSGRAPEGAAEVATMPSLPIRDIVAQMLTDSDNETAEAALKEVGHAESGEGSWAAGAAAATELLSDAGVAMDGVQVVDGSGLSTRNQLTCTTLVDVLTSPRTGPVVREGLAVAGETGTLATRWDGTPAEGRLRAKTGTLRNVTALAGEIDVADGETVTFAYVANVPDPNQISSDRVGLMGLADLLMRYPQGVDLAALQPAAATPPAAG